MAGLAADTHEHLIGTPPKPAAEAWCFCSTARNPALTSACLGCERSGSRLPLSWAGYGTDRPATSASPFRPLSVGLDRPSCPSDLCISSRVPLQQEEAASTARTARTRLTEHPRWRSVTSALYMTVRGSPQRHRWEVDVRGTATPSQAYLSSHDDRTVVKIKQRCCAPRRPRDANGEPAT